MGADVDAIGIPLQNPLHDGQRLRVIAVVLLFGGEGVNATINPARRIGEGRPIQNLFQPSEHDVPVIT